MRLLFRYTESDRFRRAHPACGNRKKDSLEIRPANPIGASLCRYGRFSFLQYFFFGHVGIFLNVESSTSVSRVELPHVSVFSEILPLPSLRILLFLGTIHSLLFAPIPTISPLLLLLTDIQFGLSILILLQIGNSTIITVANDTRHGRVDRRRVGIHRLGASLLDSPRLFSSATNYVRQSCDVRRSSIRRQLCRSLIVDRRRGSSRRSHSSHVSHG